MKGCAFHWAQAVWRKTQELGLQTSFNNDSATNRYIKQLLALPYLPHQHIKDCLEQLKDEASTPATLELCEYIKTFWMESNVWPPSSW